MGNWTEWYKTKNGKTQAKRNSSEPTWEHYLIAPLDETKPDENHIHMKADRDTGERILCSIVENGIRVHSRRVMLDRINNLTDLNLKFK